MLVACVILLVSSKRNESADLPITASPVVAVILAIISTVILCIRTILVKFYTEKFEIDSFTFTAASYFIGGLVFTIVSLINFAMYGEDIMFIIKCVLSGMINSFGFILVNHSTTTGYAGPAAALVNIQTIIHTILSAIIMNQVPTTQQIIAVVVGLGGSVLIT